MRYEIKNEDGRYWLSPEAGDHVILPIDGGIRYEVGEDIPGFSTSFNCRTATLGMILHERCGEYIALVIIDTVDASYEVTRDGELAVVKVKADEIQVLSGELADIIGRYRELRREQGILVTLEEKSKRLPRLGELYKSAIVWLWQDDYERLMYSNREEAVDIENSDGIVRAARELKAVGVEHALWGIFFKSDESAVAQLEELGYMATKYDNYNDVPPESLIENLPVARVNECDYLKRRIGDYPDKIRVAPNGGLATAWQLDGLDGKRHSQYTMCPSCALEAMKREIPSEIEGIGYSARFIDVFGCSLSDCYSKAHPLTKRESIETKRAAYELLISLGLISGTEDGFELMLPTLCYNEGIASPIYLRYNYAECGRRKARLYEEPEQIEWFRENMLKPERRFPLWELCYRDCMISFPYWGDSFLCCPDLWRERLLIAALFANPPLYSFFERDLERLKPLISETYRKLRRVIDAVGDSPMIDYGRVGDKLYRSRFANGVEIAANFSDEPRIYRERVVDALEFVIFDCAEEY